MEYHSRRNTQTLNVLFYVFLLFFPVHSEDEACVVKGRLFTQKDWYGYILRKTFHQANAQIQYQISYPVSDCCANLLIYYDDQTQQLSDNMTCTQKESVLPPTQNQIIPLNNGTGGCKIWSEPGGAPMYVCVGERMIRSSSPRTWYVAVSRCGSKSPIAMNYQFNVTGFYGACEEEQNDKQTITPLATEASCIIKGRIHTRLDWYGYLLQKTFQENTSRIQYQISYPVKECCVNLLIYYDDQMRKLSPHMTCTQREAVLPWVKNQIIPLTDRNGTVGCKVVNENGQEPMYVCVGERIIRSSAPRTWYVAISRCGSSAPLTLNYYFNISGYYGQCEEDPLANTYIPPRAVVKDDSNLHLAIGMGVIAGIATIAAVVLATLLIWTKRKEKQKPKTTGSVTSSQATMTQDIFYVNPSLSDREQSDSQYSRSSSENYYEVIPDRRSYESINTQLALSGHGGRAINLATIPREHRARIPSYIFEDIPPPPYQPPQLLAQAQGHQVHPGYQSGHHSQGSGGSHQSQGSGSGHPLLSQSGSGSNTNAQHIPLSSRMLTVSTPSSLVHGPIGQIITTRAPLQSSAYQPGSAGNTLQMPGNSASGSQTNTGSDSIPNGGITTSAGGLNSHNNTNTSPKTLSNGNAIPLQNGGPVQNGTIGRYPLHNTNHAKLLHHAYRIQQFETTA